MKKITALILTAFTALSLTFADTASDIAKAGDSEWDKMVSTYKANGQWKDTISASIVVDNFPAYYNKIMPFPAIDFSDFVTDKNGTKYYWCGEKTNWNIFVIKYNDGIQDYLYKLNNALGNYKGSYEVLGRITDAYSWWGDVVEMEVVAVRVKGRATIKIEGGKPLLVGEKLLNDAMNEKAASWTKGIPDNASSVPQNLTAEETAKWFLYYGSVKKNQDIWKKLCSAEEEAVKADGTLLAKGESWWRNLSKTDRDYYFVRSDDSRGSASEKFFMYQIRVNGQDAGVAKPMCVIKEKNGSWKVKSF
ncbi:hypothetical protein [Treponema sp. C6A8]|uniref:hypothetical protein n=1 Tax=Treponema sp. C6A8 TaxID=1410609 RepID=UPI000485652B|nr:hypothetical protein [Treponema sp. C6A8]